MGRSRCCYICKPCKPAKGATSSQSCQHRSKEMFRRAIYFVRNPSDAEDVVHQSFLYNLKNFDKISEFKCPKTRSYIAIITENNAKDLLQKRKRHPEIFLEDTVDKGAMASFEDKVITRSTLADALEQLSKQYQDALILRYDNGCTTDEVAKILHTTPDTAQRVISRARKALEKAYEKGNPDEIDR